MSLVLRFYDSILIKRPLATKMATNFAICCAGDLICQNIVSRAQRQKNNSNEKDADEKANTAGIDLKRTARFGTVGACVQTTLLHWYLTRVVPRLNINAYAVMMNPVHRKLANFSLRMGVHLTTLLPFRIGVIFFSLSTL